jgi:hypothetical protein
MFHAPHKLNALRDPQIPLDAKKMFGVMCPNALLWKPHRAHLSMKNSASRFRAPDAPECTM